MSPLLVAPLGLALLGLAGSWFLPYFVRPSICVRLLVSAMGAAMVGTMSALVLVVLASVDSTPGVARWVWWCQAVYPGSHGSSVLAGLIAASALGFALVRMVRQHQRFRAESSPFVGARPLEVVDTDRPVAFAVPGHPGTVVVSSVLLTLLDQEECGAVLAHERAHLDDHHHRYVRFAAMCSAAFPFLIPMRGRIRFQTERWADERAAEEVGSREVVARAIARVGLLASDGDSLSLGLIGCSTVSRVRALTSRPRDRGLPVALGVSAVLLGVVFVGSSIQVHHLAALLAHLCGP